MKWDQNKKPNGKNHWNHELALVNKNKINKTFIQANQEERERTQKSEVKEEWQQITQRHKNLKRIW